MNIAEVSPVFHTLSAGHLVSSTFTSRSGVQTISIKTYDGQPFAFHISGKGFALTHMLSVPSSRGMKVQMNRMSEEFPDIILAPTIARFDDLLSMALRTTVLA